MQRILITLIAFWVGLTGLTALAQPVITTSPTRVNPTCTGDANGAIVFSLPRPALDYLFDWSGGNAMAGLTQGLDRQSGLVAATYNVYVLDLVTFRDTTVSVTLAEPNPLLISAGSNIRTCVGLPVLLSGTSSASGTFTWTYQDGAGILRTLTGSSVSIPSSGAGSLLVNTTTRVRLLVMTPAGCSARDSLTVTVNPVPVSNFTYSNTEICQGGTSTVEFTGLASPEATYSWVLIGGGGAFTANELVTVTGQGPHQVRFDVPGTGTPPLRSVLLRVTEPTNSGTGSCQSNRSLTLIVHPNPVTAFVNLPARICRSAPTLALEATPTGGVFSGPGVTGTTFRPNVAGTGTHTLTYRYVTPAGCRDSTTAQIAVIEGPTASLSGIAPSYCQTAGVITPTVSPAGGTLLGPGVRGLQIHPDSAPVGTHVYQYIVVDTVGCRDTARVTVDLLRSPIMTLTPDSLSICSGQPALIALSADMPGATFAYDPQSQTGVIGAMAGTGPFINQTLTGEGPISYRVTASAGGCLSLPRIGTVRVIGQASIVITPLGRSVCSGDSIDLRLSTNPAGATISWRALGMPAGVFGPVSGTGSVIAGLVNNLNPTVANYQYEVTSQRSGCPGDTGLAFVTVLPRPQIQIQPSDTTLCLQGHLSIPLTSSTPGATFSWVVSQIQGNVTGPLAGSGPMLTQTLFNPDTLAGSVTYAVRASTGGCLGPDSTLIARLLPSPRVSALPDTLFVCSGAAISFAPRLSPAGTTVNWTLVPVEGQFAGALTGTGHTVSTTLSGGGRARLYLTPRLGDCTGLTDSLWVRLHPSRGITWTGGTTLACNGIPLSVAFDPTLAQVTWTPRVALGVVGMQPGTGLTLSDTLVNLTQITQVVTYDLEGIAGNCPTRDTTLIVQLDPVTKTIILTGNLDLCSGAQAELRFAATNGNPANFSWVALPDPSITGPLSGTDSLSAIYTHADTVTRQVRLTVTGLQGACPLPDTTFLISLRPTPRLGLSAIPQSLCVGEQVSLALRSEPAGATSTWTVLSGGIPGIAPGSGAVLSGTALSPGQVTLVMTPTLAGCTGLTDTLTLHAWPVADTADITPAGPLTFCEGGQIVLTSSVSDSIQWFRDGASLSGQTFETITAEQGGLYMVQTLSPRGCHAMSAAVTISIDSLPIRPVLAGTQVLCPGASGFVMDLTSGPGSLTWLHDGAPIPGNSDSLVITQAGVYRAIRVNGAGCGDTSLPYLVSPATLPVMNPTLIGAGLLCPGDSLTLSITILSSDSLQVTGWASLTSPIAGLGVSQTILTPGTYWAQLVTRQGCPVTTDSAVINQRDTLSRPTIVGQRSVCVGGMVTLSVSVPDSTVTYEWRQDGSYLATGPSVDISLPGVYQVTASKADACSALSDTVRILLAPPVVVPVISGDTTLCPGSTVFLTVTSGPGMIQWRRDGLALPGATDTTLLVTQEGQYTFERTSAEGCRALSAEHPVLLQAAPVAGPIVGDTALCEGGRLTLMAPSPIQGILTWLRDGATHPGDTMTLVTLPGAYQYIVRSAAGCADTSARHNVRLRPAGFVLTATSQDATCLEGGRVTLTATPTQSGLSFELHFLSLGTTLSGATHTNLAAGVYLGTASDTILGCQATSDTILIRPADGIMALAQVTQPAPCLEGTGGITLTLAPAMGAYTYEWSGTGMGLAAGAAVQNGLSAGTYQVIIRDTLTGCRDSLSGLTVQPAPTLAPSLASQNPTLCLAFDGQLSLTTAFPADTLRWNRGATLLTVGTNQVIGGLGAGSYRVIVQGGACRDTLTAQLVDPLRCDTTCNLRLIASSNPVTCAGGADGQALGFVMTGSGSGPVAYQLNGQGSWLTRQDSLFARFTGLPSGPFLLAARLVQDTTCVASAGAQIGTRTTLLTLIRQSTVCGQPTRIEARTSGGQAPYQMSLDGGLTFSGAYAGDTTFFISTSATLLLREAGGCQSGSITLTVPPSTLPRVAMRALPATCQGLATGGYIIDSVAPGASLTVRVMGRGPAAPVQVGTAIRGLGAGTYSLFLADPSTGCMWDTLLTIAEPPALAPQVTTATPPTCGLSNGVIRLTGFTADTAQVRVWIRREGGAFVTPSRPINDSLFGGLEAGRYQVVMGTAGGCRDSVTHELSSPTGLFSVSLTPGVAQVCPGQPITLRAITTHALPGVMYQWMVNGVTVSGAGADTLRLTSLLSGDSVQVQVRTMTPPACLSGLPALSRASRVTFLSASDRLAATLVPNALMVCPGTPVTLTGRSGLYAAGSRFEFWVNDTLRQSGLDSTYLLASAQAQDSIRLVVHAAPSLICLSPASDTSHVLVVQGLAPGVAQVTIGYLPVDTIRCPGQGARLEARTALATLPGVTYQWFRNNVAIAGATDRTYLAVELAAGQYRYYVRVSVPPAAATCLTGLPAQSAPLQVRYRAGTSNECQPCQLRLRVARVQEATCQDRLDGQVVLTALGAGRRLQYAFLDTTPTFLSTPLFDGLGTGVYSFIVRDSIESGCADTLRGVAVGVQYRLSVQPVLTRPSACTSSPDGQIDLSGVLGGVGPYLSRIRSTDALSRMMTYTALPAGSYPIVIADSTTGCSQSMVLTLEIRPRPTAQASVVRGLSCHDDQTALVRIDTIINGQGAYRYSLRPDSGFVGITLGQPLPALFGPGVHTLYVRDGGPCLTSTQVTVANPARLIISVDSLRRSACSMPTGSATVTASGGGTGRVLWLLQRPGAMRSDTINPMTAGQRLVNLEGGTYFLSLLDSVGCLARMSFVIPSDAPQAMRIATWDVCPGATNGRIEAIGTTGGTTPYTYRIERADGFLLEQPTPTFSGLREGTYMLTITDASAPLCRARYTRAIGTVDSLRISVLSQRPSTCSALDGQTVLRLTGGVSPYRYQIDTISGGFGPISAPQADTLTINGLTARPAGVMHRIRLIDNSPEGGCQAVLTFRQPGQTPLTYSVTHTDLTCHGDSSARISLIGLTGTGPIVLSAFEQGTSRLLAQDSIRQDAFAGHQLSLTGLKAGAYHLVVRQYGVCQGQQSTPVVITEPTAIRAGWINRYSTWTQVARGELDLLSIEGGAAPYRYSFDQGEWITFTGATYFDNLMPGPYPLLIEDSLGCRVPVTMTVVADTAFMIPNVLSPDGDGINDTWILPNMPEGTHVRILNRWGKVVYESAPYRQDWQAVGLPKGVYFYQVTRPGREAVRGWLELLTAGPGQ